MSLLTQRTGQSNRRSRICRIVSVDYSARATLQDVRLVFASCPKTAKSTRRGNDTREEPLNIATFFDLFLRSSACLCPTSLNLSLISQLSWQRPTGPRSSSHYGVSQSSRCCSCSCASTANQNTRSLTATMIFCLLEHG